MDSRETMEMKTKIALILLEGSFTYEFLEKKYQEMKSFLEQETLQRDGNLEEDYGDALIKQFKDIHEEDEFNGKIHLNERQPEGNTWLVVGNTKVRSPSREGGYKGFIIECHNDGKRKKGQRLLCSPLFHITRTLGCSNPSRGTISKIMPIAE